MVTHGMGKQTVYNSVYGVVNVVNAEPSLDFNNDGALFPSHDEQRNIAAGFELKSVAGFDKIIMAIDGMLVWTFSLPRGIVKLSTLASVCFIVTERINLGGFLWLAVIMKPNFVRLISSIHLLRPTILLGLHLRLVTNCRMMIVILF